MLRRLLPEPFRGEHADELLQHHVDRRGGARRARGPGFWLPLAGDVLLTAARTRLGVVAFDSLLRDVRFGLRQLRRNPGFAVAAVLTLTLGIGANTSIFSLVYGVLVRPLPYPEPDRLVWMSVGGSVEVDLEEWRDGLRALETLEAFTLTSFRWLGPDGPRRLRGMPVSDGLLPLLGAVTERGRLWSAAEGLAGGPPVVVVSHRFWRDGLGGRELQDLAVRLGDTTRSVVGVLSPDFHSLGYGDIDVWLPRAHAPPRPPGLIGRLPPASTLEAARAQATDLLARLEPTREGGRPPFVNTNRFRDIFSGDLRAPLLALFGAAGLVLLLACANVATLLLSRASDRAREITVRAALGASRRALRRQLLTEGALLALAGGGLGALLARTLIHRVPGVLAPRYFGRLGTEGVQVDSMALAFAATATTLTVFLAGLGPALAASRASSSAASSRGRATSGRTARRWREGFVAGEVALAFVILVGTTLLVRTYLTLRPADPGFEVRDRVVAALELPGRSSANVDFVRRLDREVELAVPGADAAVVTEIPFSGMIAASGVLAIDGVEPAAPDGRNPSVDVHAATPDYLDVVEMDLVAGRGLTGGDVPGAPFALVVNEAAAERLWPGEARPMGRRLTVDLYDDTAEFTVVGVVANARNLGGTTRIRPQVFASYAQVPLPRAHLVAHLPRGGRLDEGTIRRLVQDLDPSVPVTEVTTFEDVAAGSMTYWRYQMTLMAAFAGLALILALVGCYGVLAHAVGRRKREIGVRMALGAGARSIQVRVLARGAALVAVGLGAGTLLALAVTRVLESSLYGVSPTDPVSFLATAAVMGPVALAAAWLPARRAAAVEPARTLAAE